MQLSDTDIVDAIGRQEISIDPYDPSRLQPASYDVTLGNEFLIPTISTTTEDGTPIIDGVVRDQDYASFIADTFVIHPGSFLLATTVETIGLHYRTAAKFEGKSSLGRMGLMTHITAGFIDPGFVGQITLEIKNVQRNAVRLHAGMAIGQIVFTRMMTDSTRRYGSSGLNSKYQNQQGATGVRRG